MSALQRVIPVSILIVGVALLYPMQQSIDRASPGPLLEKEALYLSSGKTLKRMSLGLEALVADIYWIRTVQYFGRKVIESGKPLSSAVSRDLRMDLLAPLLDIVVTLDPQHIPAYRFGAVFLPERDISAAISLLEKGIRENPDEWRLYGDLAYIYWQHGNSLTADAQNESYANASQWYDKGSQLNGAPWWMRDLSGLMKIKGGSREAARRVYETYLTSDDDNIRGQAVSRLRQLHSLDELDVINAVLTRYREKTGSCPADLRGLSSVFRSLGLALNAELLPTDPEGFAYSYDAAKCRVDLAFESPVPR